MTSLGSMTLINFLTVVDFSDYEKEYKIKDRCSLPRKALILAFRFLRAIRNPDFFPVYCLFCLKKSASSNPVIFQITESWLKRQNLFFSTFPLAEHYGRLYIHFCPFIGNFNFGTLAFFSFSIELTSKNFKFFNIQLLQIPSVGSWTGRAF